MSNAPTRDSPADRPPRQKRRVLRSFQLFAAILLVIGCASTAIIGVPIWLKQAAIGEIEAAGGLFGTQPGGPPWLRQCVGDPWASYFDDVVQVRLDNPRATDATLGCLQRFPRLQSLSLDNSQVTDSGLARLCELKALAAVSLRHTRITDAGIGHLARVTGLQGLDLDDTAITDAGLVHFQGLVALRWLSLNNTAVSDAGLERLKGMPALSGLELNGTQVTDAGLAHLKRLPQLQMLKLEDTQVTDDGFAEFRVNRPALSGGPRGYEERRKADRDSPRAFVDQAVYGRRGPKGARTRLERLLSRKIAALERTCGLSATQERELEAAGRTDIEQVFERIQEQISTLVPPEGIRSAAEADRLTRETDGLRRLLARGPFQAGSHFAGALEAALTPEQTARIEQRSTAARESGNRIGVENAADLTRIADLPIDAWKIVWNRGGTEVAFVRLHGAAQVYDAGTMQFIRTLGEGRALTGFDFSPRDDRVALSDQSAKQVLVVDSATGRETEIPSGNLQPSVTFSSDGQRLAIGGYERGIGR